MISCLNLTLSDTMEKTPDWSNCVRGSHCIHTYSSICSGPVDEVVNSVCFPLTCFDVTQAKCQANHNL